MSKEKFLYLTTPVFYTNDKPHLGHAFTVVIADCLKRYYSELGYKCWLSVGTDEHGEKILNSAKSANVPVEKFIDKNVACFKNLWKKLGIKYDKFVRTSDYAHKNQVRKIFEKFLDINQIFFDDWRGWYCPSCEENYSLRSIGKSTVCKLGHPLVMHNEKTYFLRTNPFKSWIIKEYQEKENLIVPIHYKKEMLNNFVNDLDDLSVSRENLEWGIRVPDREDHSIYVWFDALLSYLTALNYGNYGNTNTNTFQTYWNNPDCKIIQIIGKEICRFHSIYWPIILKNLDLRLFDTLLVHGWLLMGDEKMSKSKKNVIDPESILEYIPREGLRLYLARINFFTDSNVNESDILSTYNTYLANTFGNLISRFYGIMSKKFDLKLPNEWKIEEWVEIAQLNIELDKFLNEEYFQFVDNKSPFLIVERVFELFRSAGKLIEKYKIWSLESSDSLLQTMVIFVYKLLCIGTWAMSPILIDTASEIYSVLNISSKKIGLEYLKQHRLFCKKTINPLNKVFFPRIQPDISGK